VQPLAGRGISNRLFLVEADGERFVLRRHERWPYAESGRSLAALEAEVHARVIAAGVPAPRVIAQELGAVLLEYLEGETLAEVEEREGEPAVAGVWRAAGVALATVHALPESGCSPSWAAAEILENARRLGDRGAISAGLRAWLEAGAPALAASLQARPCRLLHGDPHPSNVLVRRSGSDWILAAWLDWEASRPGDPAWDLARLELGRRAEGLAVPSEFYDGYGARLDPELLDSYELVFQLRLARRKLHPRVRFLSQAADRYLKGLEAAQATG